MLLKLFWLGTHKIDHQFSSKTLGKSFLDGRLSKDERSPYLIVQENQENLMNKLAPLNLKGVLEVHVHGGFSREFGLGGKSIFEELIRYGV